jgi:hypothetical protein
MSESIGHLTKNKTTHLAHTEIPHMADASRGFSLYAGARLNSFRVPSFQLLVLAQNRLRAGLLRMLASTTKMAAVI